MIRIAPGLRYLLVMIGIACLARWQVPPHAPSAAWVTKPASPAAIPASVTDLLDQLERECDLSALGNDYLFYPVPPTEARRRDLLSALRNHGASALAEVRSRLKQPRGAEFGEMLVLAAAALGDETSVAPAGRLMLWSPSPAVRISAVRIFRQLHDPRSIEWLRAALDDDRFVLNCGCGTPVERYYPIRTVAEIALIEMGQKPSIQP